MTQPGQITRLIRRLGDGDPTVMRRLLPLVYEELRRLAGSHRFSWRDRPRTPSTTSVVHEAYLRLVDQSGVDWRSRDQFFALASRAMRSVLVDNARAHDARKRGGDRRRVPLEDGALVSEERREELIALDDALDELEREDPRLVRIVECRFFAGLTVEETAQALGVSPSTVKRGWRLARSWLYRKMQGDGATAGARAG